VLVEAHQGTIAARSAFGKGSACTITLPRGLVSTGPAAGRPAQARPAAPGGAA
jgi:hypothetical protein